jgi:hypothetical protein
MIELCNCVHSHYLDCLMQRYQASKSFAECMGGCPCPCHFLKNGAFVPSGDWLEHRYHVARALQQAREERHTDPRIEAVMPQKVVER